MDLFDENRLKRIIAICIGICFLLGAVMVYLLKPNHIVSNKPIIPEIIIKTNNNDVDTIYIYKK